MKERITALFYFFADLTGSQTQINVSNCAAITSLTGTAQNSSAARTGSRCNVRLFNDTEIWLQVTSYLLIILFSSFGNTVIISIVKKNRRMRSPTNYFIVNLCLANLMIMLMNVVPYVVGRISPRKGYGISGRYLQNRQQFSMVYLILKR